MNVLSIGSDRKVFEPHSRVRDRLVAYGEQVDSYHVIVTCGRSVKYSELERRPSSRVELHPTYSFSRFSYPLSVVRAGYRLLRQLKSKGNWVVTAQDPFESGFSAWWIARSFRVPLQVQLHTDPFTPQFVRHSTLNWIRMVCASFVLPRATRIRVVSESLKQHVHAKYRVSLERIDVLPVLVEASHIENADQHPIRSRLPTGARVVLMVGRLAREKDMEVALRAFTHIHKKVPTAHLVIVGDGPLRPQLEKIASNENLQSAVLFLGWQHEVMPYYHDADVFLFSSQYEGYGMVLVEAAVAGCPIVSTDVGIAKEFFGDRGGARVCPVGDSDCLAREAVDLLVHEDVRQAMGSAAATVAYASYVSTLESYAKKQAEIWLSMLTH